MPDDTDIGAAVRSLGAVQPGHDAAAADKDIAASVRPANKPVMQRNSLQDDGMWDVPGGGALPSVVAQPGGWRIPVDPSLTPSPDAGNLLPISRDPATGEGRLAWPNIIRGLTTEGPQIKDGNLVVPGATFDPNTGRFGVTPDTALSASIGQPGPLRFSAPLVPFGPPRPPPFEMRALPKPPDPPPVPSYPQAKAIRDAWYDRVDGNEGAATKPGYTNEGVDDAIKTLQPKGPLSAGSESPTIGQVRVTLNNARDQPITLGDYAAHDRDLTGLIQAETNLTTAGRLRKVQADLRQHFEGAGPDDIVGGQEGFDALDPARRAHTQVSKMGDLEDMIYRSGMYDNTAGSMRSQLRNHLASDASSNLTDLERAAYERAQRAGPLGTGLLAVQHIASPWVGAALGGPKGAVAAEATRGGLNVWRSAVARARVQDALRVLGQGVPPPPE